jgi:Glyoxalase-like domain
VPVQLDHVLIAVQDLAAATQGFESRYGLEATGGGRHPGWGTANRIVPLGDAYVELVAVVDDGEAATSAFGKWVAGGATAAGRLLGWAVRTDDLDSVAQRLGLAVSSGSRDALRWRLAGLEEAVAKPPLPFFIAWAPGTALPGRAAPVDIPVARLVLQGPRGRLSEWLGEHTLPVAVEPGSPGVAELVLAYPSGEISIYSP